MPTFHIELFEGRSVEHASVDIIIQDVKRENWATAGTLWSDKKS